MKILRKLQKRISEDKKTLARRRRQEELSLTRKLGEKVGNDCGAHQAGLHHLGLTCSEMR
jgi:hypothetical protein